MTNCAVVCIVFASIAGQPGRCSCTPSCACGCQQGKLCDCLHDGKQLPRPIKPAQPDPVNAKEEERQPVAKKIPNFGVDLSKIRPGQHYLWGAHQEPLTKDEAIDRLEAIGQQIPDDAAKVRLTVIGSEEERKRVLADLDGPLKSARQHCVVQAYASNSPILEGLGFVVSGHPTIYLQLPDGTVLHRQDDYDGPQRLLTALRKTDPNYDPANDPDLAKPKPPPAPPEPAPVIPALPDLSRVPGWVWLLVAGGAYLFFSKSDSPQPQPLGR